MIFIPYNVPSLKNSKIATSKGVFMSKTCRKYLQNLGIRDFKTRLSKKQVKNGVSKVTGYKSSDRPNLFKMAVKNYFKGIKYPCKIGFHFVRDSKRQFDFHNAVQMVADLLVAHDCIEDDSMKYFLPFPMKIDGKWYSVDKEKPGVYLKVLKTVEGF